MNFRGKNSGKKEGFEPNWWYVLAALVLGLIIPDKLNPLHSLLSKFGSKEKEDEKNTKPNPA